jgi:hypothetical protein
MKTVKINLPPEFEARCEDAQIDPKLVLEGFIRDLCALDGSHGSDERDLAQLYFSRCGYERF